MDLGIGDKVAVVTASSRGLGLGTAKALAAEGARVVVNSRSAEGVAAAEDALRAHAPGAEIVGVVADMGDPGGPAAVVQHAIDAFGRVDIAVANNGGPPPARGLDVTDEQVLAAVNDNQLSAIRLVRAVVPSMRERGWGRICCITSSAVRQPLPVLPLSNIARTGLLAWAKTTADELFPDGITLNLACPGMHATDRTKDLGVTGPMGDADDFGAAVAFLCSAQAAFVTGTTLLVDGGATAAL